ncbi:MAG TPA: PEP-CTERM sorting domain-containing protein [Acetobacteraceae bacterium]
MLGLLGRLGGTCAIAAIAASPAMATPVTFAQYFQQNGALQQWSITTSGTTTTVKASGAVYFLFSGVSGLPFSGMQTATFSLSATSKSIGACGVSCGAGDSLTQAGYTGTFSFIDTDSDPGANLLSGTFAVTGSPSTTGAQFSSHVGSSGASFDASATAGNLSQLVFTSQFLAFLGETDETASWSLSSLIPNFATGRVTAKQAYPAAGPFKAAGSGTFSSNPGPVPIPEPETFALLGTGLLGLGFLTRKKSLADTMSSRALHPRQNGAAVG